MVRFQPDTWIEGLLRPLLMADPVAGLYFELAAPDWRFALFFAFITIAMATRGSRARLAPSQGVGAIGLLLSMGVWTFVSGNGRYFIWGLVMVGPLLVMALRLLPGTRGLHLSLLALVAGLQFVVVQNSYTANAWGTVGIEHNPVPLDNSPLRHEPAVFLTLSALSFSALVPRFHPEARWAAIGGQYLIKAGSPEHRRLKDLLTSPLPKYLMLPLDGRGVGPQGQIPRSLAGLVTETLARYDLALAGGECTFLNSTLSRVTHDRAADGVLPQPGFWFCALQRSSGVTAPAPDLTERYVDVFQRIEQRCPRFFPPGSGRPVHADDSIGLFYAMTDMRVLIDRDEDVYFRYFRAMNPTRLGNVADVRKGSFDLPCRKPPGRYIVPWQRD